MEVLLELKKQASRPGRLLQNGNSSGWFTRERLLTLSLTLLTIGFIYLCFLLVKPFIPAIAFAIALAVATARPYGWLRRRFKGDTACAAVGVTLVAILIVVPLVTLGTYIVQAGVDSIDNLRSGKSDWQSVVARQPQLQRIVSWATKHFDVPGQIRNLGETIAGQMTSVLAQSISIVAQLGITLFVLFFLFRDGRGALRSLPRLLPLSASETDRLLSRISNTIRATVNGSLTIALIQSLLAGAVYFLLGIPGSPLWASATFVAALIPMFGTALVWGPIAAYLALAGSWTKAVILLAWGAAAVGSIDNVLYPVLVGDKLRLHTVPTFFSIFGGITLFGPVGLILGPLVLAITIALLDIWWYRTTEGHSAEEKIALDSAPSSPPGTVLQKKVPRKIKAS